MPRLLARLSLVLLSSLTGLSASLSKAQDPPPLARVQLLGFNDFHGQLSAGRRLRDRPVGSAAVFAAYLRDETANFPGETLIVHAGDFVGASPPASGLLQDEPSIAFLNLLGNRFCSYASRLHARCNVVGTPGNHEFDEGLVELMRLLRGGQARGGPYLERPYRGARFGYVSANVLDGRRGLPLFPEFAIKQLGPVRLAIVGAVLEATPSMVVADGVRGVRFAPEAAAINRAVRKVRALGVEAIVVAIHQGAPQALYEGLTRTDVAPPTGEIAAIVAQLDGAVDVVISGHAHAFTNAVLHTASGQQVLVTQALSAGMAYAAIELAIDRTSGEVVDKRARVVVTYADQGPGLTPAADVLALVARAEAKVAPQVSRVVGHAAQTIAEDANAAGESALGNLIADAQRAAMRADIAFMNPGGIRVDLQAGEVTWGELFAIHPFGNALVALELTGADLLRVLEQQWQVSPPRIMPVSGLTYTWDASKPLGARVIDAKVENLPLSPTRVYRVVANDFLAGGGDGFTHFARATKRLVGMRDIEALSAWIEAQKGKVEARIEGRITRRD
jgi:5'-nucleotidase